MGRRHYVPLRRRHDIPIRRCEDMPLRCLGDVPLRRRWLFHQDVHATSLGGTRDVAATLPQRLVAGWDDVNNIYERAMSQKVPVHFFKKVKETSQFNEDFT